MTINVPIRELTRLRSLQDKVGQLLGRDKLDATLKNDLSKLYDSLSYGAKKLEDLNNKNISLGDITSPEMRHDIRNVIGISKGYAELIKDTAENPSTSLSNLLDKIVLWSSKTITTLEKIKNKDFKKTLNSNESLKKRLGKYEGKVLILDDEEANRELLSRYIQQFGMETFTCEHASDAYETLKEVEIDLILLDLVMPDISGHEVLSKLKNSESWRAIPVIIISGISEQDEVIRCIQAGAEDYLQKPFNKVLLEARIYAGLDRKRWLDKERHLKNEIEKSHRFIKNTFGRYLSSEIVSKLLDKPDGLDMGGKLQTVTILMADIRSFTTISESLPPQQVVKILNNYLGAMADVIMAHDGTVDEFIGDAILALFGAPVSKSDDSERAISCAIEMQAQIESINKINQSQGLPSISMGIGINTGEVIAGNIGSAKRAKYGVVGHTVNLTSRIEDQTKPGEILVSKDTLKNSKNIFKTGRSIKLQPKGISETISVLSIEGYTDKLINKNLKNFK
jgi:adenylate cyclase